VISKDFNILETGSGGSSLFFLQRCKTLTSLEHDKKWILELENKISFANYKNRWSLVLRDLKTDSLNDSPYLDFLTTQKDESFDLISIDGRLRNESLKIASYKLKRGGFILLDNSDRNEYKQGIEFINSLGWSRQDLNGFCYSLEWDSRSTIWQRK
jgi:predicted O-methyltransferase YrrM